MCVEPDHPAYEQAVRGAAEGLTRIARARCQGDDARSWEAAAFYVSAFERAALALHGRVPTGREETRLIARINRDVRRQEGYEGPGASWLSHAKRLYSRWPEVFGLKTKALPYNHYRQIVASSLDGTKQYELRRWAERNNASQAAVARRIREAVDAQRGVTRPDFDLKVGNCWRFNDKSKPSGFDGGIHPDLVANLLYYFTDPGDVVLDPMAGGDTTYRVLRRYRFFREVQ